MSNISLSLGCLFFVLILLIVCIIKKFDAKKENKVYFYLLVATFFGLVLDNISFFMTNLKVDYNSFVYILVTKSIFCYYAVWGFLLLLYVVAVTCRKNDNYSFYNKCKIVTFFILLPIIVGLISISDLHYVYQNNSIFPDGASVSITYSVAGLTLLFVFLILIKNKKFIMSKEYIPIAFLLIFTVLSVVIQKIVPGLILVTASESLVTAIMFFTIENPDIKMIKQLQLAREAADKANRSKSDFLSSMSHEIRTPLNAIVGFSDCILDAQTLTEAKENAKDIVNASGTLLEIVNGILDISKIEAGKVEIVNSKYKAVETFNELAKLITPRMNDKGLDFTYYIDPSLPQVLFGDYANIKKIVTNLLSNACKYTDRGFVRYEVNCVRQDDFVRLIISVEDSGRGIKKESVEKLFTKFQRLDEDKNTTIEGTGLGLAITKQLAELMGGRIICHTIYGQGSKFTAVINQKIVSDEVENSSSDVDVDCDFSDIKILLVDDAPLNIKVAVKLLQKYNALNIDTCDSGFACIEKIKAGNKYDLVLLDDMMPKMSGIETLTRLKEDPNYNTYTVALTANALTGMREKYISHGFNDYISKPIDKLELCRVYNALKGRVNDVVVEETEEEDPLEKTMVIPVEANIEEILGSSLDLTDRDNIDFSNDSNKEEVVESDEIESLEEEVLEDGNSQDVVTDDGLLAVVDIGEVAVPSENNNDVSYDKDYLTNNGADLDKAMELLGDMEMYNSTIHDFYDEVDEKWNRINEYKNNNDMPNYAIDVHSLKSDCKYLGFMGLADIAYQHELKSKENDSEFVNEHFSELEEEYNRVIEVVKNYVSANPVDE